jgi:hypothetical protein
VADDLAGLLGSGERAAFHGRPDDGVAPLGRAVEIAEAAARPVEAAAARWLLGVCHASAGRYGTALVALEPVTAIEADAPPERRAIAALAAASVASVHRQLGRHAEARTYDEMGLGWTEGSGEAAFDCRLGLAADAVGMAEEETARSQLARAATLVEGRSDLWRQHVRLGWLTAEVALMTNDPEPAVSAAEAAVDLAERSGAPRHVAKGLLFLGVARVEADRMTEAATALRRGGLLAESLGTLPLLWPARAVLGALLAESDPAASEACLATARRALETIAADVPAELQKQWRARPDVGALLDA